MVGFLIKILIMYMCEGEVTRISLVSWLGMDNMVCMDGRECRKFVL